MFECEAHVEEVCDIMCVAAAGKGSSMCGKCLLVVGLVSFFVIECMRDTGCWYESTYMPGLSPERKKKSSVLATPIFILCYTQRKSL